MKEIGAWHSYRHVEDSCTSDKVVPRDEETAFIQSEQKRLIECEWTSDRSRRHLRPKKLWIKKRGNFFGYELSIDPREKFDEW